MVKKIKKEFDLGGKKLILETGELAGQANGSVLATYGETVVLATAVAKKPTTDLGYFPLSVEYEEKMYAGGKISTSRFIKRENRPTEDAVLTSRLIDRSIRPLFPKDYLEDVQVIITVLSIDQENDPDMVSLIAASVALTISDIPWNGPISGLRVGENSGNYIVNPTEEEKKASKIDLIVASNKQDIIMIEAASEQADENTMAAAFNFAVDQGKKVIEQIESFAKEAGISKKDYTPEKAEPKIEEKIREYIKSNMSKDLQGKAAQDEGWFGDALAKLAEEFIKDEDSAITSKMISDILDDEVANFLREEILKNKKRPDGRSPDQLRDISARVSVLPRTHGSAVFQRGDTQALSIATLASPSLEQLIEGMEGEATKRYMHHYNFPPFSVGETGRRGAPGRREIGHGALAEKAIRPIIPENDQFPYTIRIVSEILSSAGSTSMAAVCGSTLALMDAGVPIKEPVAGISIGLITDKKDKSKYVTITDIAYQEDAQGDMDFKVAGTKNGITAIQMDIKLDGIPVKILEEALSKAKNARLQILDKILATIPASRKSVSKHAPTIILVKIDPSKIGDVIGSGGRVINKIINQTGAAIDINDEGTVTISSKDVEACKKAAEIIEGIVKEAQVGEEYEGEVKRILPFGAMVEILPGKEGLVHISKLAPYRVNKVEDVVKIGQKVKTRVAEIDDQGRVNLSMVFGNDVQDREKKNGDGGRSRDFQNRKFSKPNSNFRGRGQRQRR